MSANNKPKLIEKIFDAVTGETTTVEREMTDWEISEQERVTREALDLANSEKMKAEARNQILNKLGITEEEAKLLLS